MNSFSEKQRFTQWWLWAILAVVVIRSGWSVYADWLGNDKAGISMSSVTLGIIIPVLIVFLFTLFNLQTGIDASGISYRFFPFQLSMVKKSWDAIDMAYVREYSPLAEFGGWGIRYSFGNGRAYNVSGKIGLQIVFKNGKKLLIGTQKPGEINEVLRFLKKGGDPGPMHLM